MFIENNEIIVMKLVKMELLKESEKEKWSGKNSKVSQYSRMRASSGLYLDNTDEHFNRHLDNLNDSDKLNENKDEEEEEDLLSDSENGGETEKASSDDEESNQKEDEDDEEEEEPKLFHSEDVDLPCLVTSQLSSQNLILPLLQQQTVSANRPAALPIQLIQPSKSVLTTSTSLPSTGTKINMVSNISDKSSNITIMNEANSLPTPLMISRSSSMTSLNSCDIKSIQSSIPSEYSSHAPSSFTSPSKKSTRNNDECDYLDEIDLIMPDSPSAQHESSFLALQRAMHKEQQNIYRQNSSNFPQLNPQQRPAVSNIVDSSKPWKQCSFIPPPAPPPPTDTQSKDITNLVNRLTLTSDNSELPKSCESLCSSSTASSSSSSSTASLVFLNTPMNLKDQANKTLNTTILHSSHTPPVKLMPNTPKFITQPHFLNTAPTFLQPMSVSYAFLNSTQQQQQQQQQTQVPQTQPANLYNQTHSLPKFLTTSTTTTTTYFPSKQDSTLNFNPSFKQVNFSSNSLPTLPQQQQPQQQSPPKNDALDLLEQPHTFAPIESKFRTNNFMASDKLQSPSSPQESVCSRMSEASVPSLIRHEIAAKPATKDFSALFSKMKSVSNNFSPSKITPIAAPFDLTEESDDRRPRVFSACQDDDEVVTQPKPQFAFLDPTKTKPAFLKNVQQQQQQQQQSQTAYYNYNEGVESRGTYSPKVFCNEGGESRYSSASSISDEEEDELCKTKKFDDECDKDESSRYSMYEAGSSSMLCNPAATKPMNTPAGFGSMSGASILEPNDDDDTHSQEHQVHEDNEPTPDDPDELLLENFIKEMLPTASTSAPTENKDKPIKRRSLNTEQLSKITIKPTTKPTKPSTTTKLVNKPTKLITKPVSQTLTDKAKTKKRLSEENLASSKSHIVPSKISISKNVASNLPKNKTVTTEKVLTSAPVVNMTKTAQLRASKLAGTASITTSRKPTTVNLNVTVSHTASFSHLKSNAIKQQNSSSNLAALLNNKNKNLISNKQASVDANNDAGANLILNNLNSEKTSGTTLERRKSFSFGCSNGSNCATTLTNSNAKQASVVSLAKSTMENNHLNRNLLTATSVNKSTTLLKSSTYDGKLKK